MVSSQVSFLLCSLFVRVVGRSGRRNWRQELSRARHTRGVGLAGGGWPISSSALGLFCRYMLKGFFGGFMVVVGGGGVKFIFCAPVELSLWLTLIHTATRRITSDLRMYSTLEFRGTA